MVGRWWCLRSHNHSHRQWSYTVLVVLSLLLFKVILPPTNNLCLAHVDICLATTTGFDSGVVIAAIQGSRTLISYDSCTNHPRGCSSDYIQSEGALSHGRCCRWSESRRAGFCYRYNGRGKSCANNGYIGKCSAARCQQGRYRAIFCGVGDYLNHVSSSVVDRVQHGHIDALRYILKRPVYLDITTCGCCGSAPP